MTSPDFASRLSTAGSAVGATRPQLATALASSDLSHGEIQAVGGFVSALTLSNASKLAADSGAQTNFSKAEQASLSAINDPAAAAQEQQSSGIDSRSWLEKATDWVAGKIGNTGSFLVHNPVSQGVFDVFDAIGNAAHWPFRLLSDGLDSSNNEEIDRQMTARGYDPTSTTSYLAFMFNQGESQFHDLSKVRDHYTDELVDQVLQQIEDPEQFQKDYEQLDPTAAAELQQKMQSKEWQAAYDAVNARHISPGRDLARVLTLGHEDSEAFHLISGVTDAAYTWFADPTLIVGKGVKAARLIDAASGALTTGSALRPSNMVAKLIDSPLMRDGAQRARIENIKDQAGVEALMATDVNGKAVTQVGKGWQQFLAQAKALREQHAIAQDTTKSVDVRQAAIAQRAAIYRGMSSQYGELMPLLDEINGRRVVETAAGGKVDGVVQGTGSGGHIIEEGPPIETLDELGKYLVSENGLLRLHNGVAARQQIVMPGRVSWWAERRAAAHGKSAAKWLDYTQSNRLLPDESELSSLAIADQSKAAGDAQHELLRQHGFTSIKTARAKGERIARRFSTILPKVTAIDLTDQTSSRTVEQFARLYLNRGDAARLASAYALGDIAERRNVVKGMLMQSFHASGLTKSEAGRRFADKYLGDQAVLDRQQYGLGDTSKINTDSGERQVALYPDQLSTRVAIPSFREMNYLAAKASVGEWTGRRGIGSFARTLSQSDGMDHLMGVIKLGWIATAAGGLRNALDEVANFASTGMSKEVLAGRVAYSNATRGLREDRRNASKTYLDMVSEHGRAHADEMVGRQSGAAIKSLEDAKLQLERAKSTADRTTAEQEVNRATAERKRTMLLETAIRHRVPLALRGAADNLHDLLITPVLGKALSVFGKQWELTPDRVRWASELAEDFELRRLLKDGVFQSHYMDSALTEASDHGAMGIHRAGLPARKYGFLHEGWGEVEADGGAGLDAWAKTLGLRFGDKSSPAHSWLQTVNALQRAPVGVHGSLADFEASGEELFHGTSSRFDTFSGDRAHGNTGRGAGDRIYMTDQRRVANSFAWQGSGKAAQELPESFFYKVGRGQYEGVNKGLQDRLAQAHSNLKETEAGSPERAAVEEELANLEPVAMRQMVEHELSKGWRVRVDPLTGGKKPIIDRPEQLDELPEEEVWREPSAWEFIPPDRDPRVIKSKVYGKTIDLRTRKYPRNADGSITQNRPMNKRGKITGLMRDHEEIEPDIPADLDAALKAEKRWHPVLNQGGSNTYGHEKSKALTGWMRANGYGKALVDDAGESGLESYVTLPEMIAHGDNDPVGKYAASLAPLSKREWADVLQAARDSVRARVDDEDLRHFVKNAEIFKHTRFGKVDGNDPKALAIAKDEYADRVSMDLAQALGRHLDDGTFKINDELMHHLAEGNPVPDRSWLANNVPLEERPKHAIGQLWAPYNAAHQPGTLPMGYTTLMTTAYDKFVTDQINALSRNPLVTALYMNARKNVAPYEAQLVEAGWSKEAAAEVGKRTALAHAQDEALKKIDNPYVATQFTTVARNWFAFVRAQEDWLRRWGRTIKDNPEIIRKAQLLIHGGTAAGMIDRDPNDPTNLKFIYPGSGMMLNLFNKVTSIFTGKEQAQVPMNGELSSSLVFLNPSLDNPIGFSGTPLISLPLHALTAILGPHHQLLSASLDKAVNGDLGAGREWYEQMLPSWVNRIIGGVISKDPGSKFGAAVTQSMANMEAAGQFDDPALQTASGKAKALHALTVQTHNNLALNALFGFFAPAAPSYEGTAGAPKDGFQGREADWSAHVTGLHSLKDEARQVFADLPYDKAYAWWTKVHPNELVYRQDGTSSRTYVGTESASAPATVAAATYLEQHPDFFRDYGGKGGVAAYFIPQGQPGTKNGEYNDVAYRAQLELGIRDYKSLDDYFDDIVLSRGMAAYFAAKDDYDAQRADASPDLAKQLDAEWAAKKDEINAGNPLLAARMAQYATQNSLTGSQILQLEQLMGDSSEDTVKALGPNRVGLSQLLQAYGGYQEGAAQLGDSRSRSANQQRQLLRGDYEETVKNIAASYPGLADLTRGVFRLP